MKRRALKGHRAIRDYGADLEELDRIFTEHGHRYGAWGPLVKEEFGISYQTALRWIRYKHFYSGVAASGDFSILEHFTPSVIFIVTAPSIEEAALEEVLDRARKGQKTICREAEEIARRHRSGREDEPEGDESKDSLAEGTAAGPEADGNAEGTAAGPEADGNAEGTAVGPEADGNVEDNPKAEDAEGDPEAEDAEGYPEAEDAEGDPEAEDAEDDLEIENAEENPDVEAGEPEDEHAIRLLEAFKSAFSEAGESFFDMDDETLQEASEWAQEHHFDFLNKMAALAG
jgi:hypothetical protein